MNRLLSDLSASLLRIGWLLLCLWDIWVWRFAWHTEVFGVRDENLSWYLTGILILSTIATVLAVCWGISRFARLWGVLFWLCYLILFSYSRSFQFAGHHLLFLIFPFILLLPVRRENSTASLETAGVVRVLTLVLGISCLTSGISILVSGPFNGRIFDFYLARPHAFNAWLSSNTQGFPWGIPWAILLLGVTILLLQGGRLARLISAGFFLLWGILILTLFQLNLLGFLLLAISLLLLSTCRLPSRPAEAEEIPWYDRFPIRQSLAWMLFLAFMSHLAGTWLQVSAIRRVPEVIGYNSQWDYFSQVSWYPETRLEARSQGVWTPLIGKGGQRPWNTPEQVLLIIPAVRHAPPAELSPVLTHRMELMMRRWQVEWGERFDQYRLVSEDDEYGESTLRTLFKLPRAFEGSRSKE